MKTPKALNIRDFHDNPDARKSIGLFKTWAYEQGLTQADAFDKLVKKAYLAQIIDLKEDSYVQEFKAPKTMTREEFDQFLAEECQEDYLGEESLMRLQEEANPEDYDIVIVEKEGK